MGFFDFLAVATSAAISDEWTHKVAAGMSYKGEVETLSRNELGRVFRIPSPPLPSPPSLFPPPPPPIILPQVMACFP